MSTFRDRLKEREKKLTEICYSVGQEYPPGGFSVGDGWLPHVVEALQKIAALGVSWKLEQVKSKFCQLKIYVESDESADERIHEIIEDVANKVDTMCENCGAEVKGGPMSGTKLCKHCLVTSRQLAPF